MDQLSIQSYSRLGTQTDVSGLESFFTAIVLGDLENMLWLFYAFLVRNFALEIQTHGVWSVLSQSWVRDGVGGADSGLRVCGVVDVVRREGERE